MARIARDPYHDAISPSKSRMAGGRAPARARISEMWRSLNGNGSLDSSTRSTRPRSSAGECELRVAQPAVVAVAAVGGDEVDEGEGARDVGVGRKRSSTGRARSGRGPAVAGNGARRIPARRPRARRRDTSAPWPRGSRRCRPRAGTGAGLSRGPSGWVTITSGTNAASASASSRRFSSTFRMTWVGSSARMRSRRGVLVPPHPRDVRDAVVRVDAERGAPRPPGSRPRGRRGAR